MADINHGHPVTAQVPPVEGDGVSYSGIFWFLAILAITTVVCQGLMVGFMAIEARRVSAADAPLSPVAQPANFLPPKPNLLTDEPANLKTFRDAEEEQLNTYGWIDKGAGTVHIPIDKAKALLIERGLASGTPAPAAAPVKKIK